MDNTPLQSPALTGVVVMPLKDAVATVYAELLRRHRQAAYAGNSALDPNRQSVLFVAIEMLEREFPNECVAYRESI